METNEVRLAVESGDSTGDESWVGTLVQDNNGFTNIAEDGLVSVVEPEPQEVLAVLNPLPKIRFYNISIKTLNLTIIYYFQF